jgi:hypothetical protein
MRNETSTCGTCANCGSHEFEQGWLQTVRHSDTLCYFRSDGEAGGGGIDVTARRCLSCGLLDLLAATDNR